jgi:hypothetical protein
MTEASKARKRRPLRVLTVPAPKEPPSEALLRALREMSTAIVLPPQASLTFIRARPRRPVRVQTSGVAVAAGVGNRRRRARSRRAERRQRERLLSTARHVQGATFVSLNSPGGTVAGLFEAVGRATADGIVSGYRASDETDAEMRARLRDG